MDLVTIYSAGDAAQAELLRTVLERQDIKAIVQDDAIHANVGVGGVGGGDRVTVAVADQDAQAARQIAKLFDAEIVRMAMSEGETLSHQVEEMVDAMLIEQWPKCDGCGKPRITKCPICHTSGSDFPAADSVFGGAVHTDAAPAQERSSCGCGQGGCHAEEESCAKNEDATSEEEPSLMLVCPTCDDPFTPTFPNRCEWCGHQFPDGYETTERLVNMHPQTHSTRIVVATLALSVMTIGVIGFLIWAVQ